MRDVDLFKKRIFVSKKQNPYYIGKAFVFSKENVKTALKNRDNTIQEKNALNLHLSKLIKL